MWTSRLGVGQCSHDVCATVQARELGVKNMQTLLPTLCQMKLYYIPIDSELEPLHA